MKFINGIISPEGRINRYSYFWLMLAIATAHISIVLLSPLVTHQQASFFLIAYFIAICSLKRMADIGLPPPTIIVSLMPSILALFLDNLRIASELVFEVYVFSVIFFYTYVFALLVIPGRKIAPEIAKDRQPKLLWLLVVVSTISISYIIFFVTVLITVLLFFKDG